MAVTGTEYDSGAYCAATGADAYVAGKEVLACVFDETGANLLAVNGEQETTITMESESTEVSTKDSRGGWKNKVAGIKSWSLELGTALLKDSRTDLELRKHFDAGSPVCVKLCYDDETYTPICGGSALITSYELGAPSDDVATASISLEGSGKLTWFDIDAKAKEKATAKPSNRGPVAG